MRQKGDGTLALAVKALDAGIVVERAALYEKDRLDPVEPSAKFDAMMAKSDAAKYPAQYRYMAYRVHAAGRSLAEPVHYDGRAETEALKARYAAWLKGK